MGTLEAVNGGQRLTLGARCLIGRAKHCTLRLNNRGVSGEHATLRWSQTRWLLRDLGSSNGTAVDGEAIHPGREVTLTAGALLTFGSQQMCWKLVDAAGPDVVGRRERDGHTLRASDGLLALPDAATPECTLHVDDEGRWLIEHGNQRRALRDQERITLSDGSWLIELPPTSSGTATTRAAVDQPRLLRFATILFAVSHDGEYVELRLDGPSWQVAVGARSYNEMLLNLARARLQDMQQRPELGSAEHGWVYADDLCKMAAISRSQLDLHVFRARKQLAAAGMDDPGQLVERRPSMQQLRLGTDRIRINTLS